MILMRRRSMSSEGYRRISFLANPGKAYIDTGLELLMGDTIKCGFDLTDAYSPIGAIFSAGTGKVQTLFLTSSWTSRSYWRYFNRSANNIFHEEQYGSQCEVEITPERIMTLTQTETGRKNYATQREDMENLDGDNTTLWLFLRRNGVQPFKGSMNYFCVERSGSTILNLVPMISPSNVVGMYDTIGQQFYSSPNGETFVAGSEL